MRMRNDFLKEEGSASLGIFLILIKRSRVNKKIEINKLKKRFGAGFHEYYEISNINYYISCIYIHELI